MWQRALQSAEARGAKRCARSAPIRALRRSVEMARRSERSAARPAPGCYAVDDRSGTSLGVREAAELRQMRFSFDDAIARLQLAALAKHGGRARRQHNCRVERPVTRPPTNGSRGGISLRFNLSQALDSISDNQRPHLRYCVRLCRPTCSGCPHCLLRE
jgi:hypothetical protein